MAGQVVDGNGRPIAHAYVGALVSGDRNKYPYEVIADGDGHFDFFALDCGVPALRARTDAGIDEVV